VKFNLRALGAEGDEAGAFGRVKAMTDEQIEDAIAAIKALMAAQAGEAAKVIEGEAEVVPSLPAPARPTKAS